MALKRLDPLAQSFFVDEPIFVTKADLYFAEKDDNLPVFVQIRRNQNGAPSPDIVNFSTTVLPAANVVTSSNGNVATTVTFSSPVFLDIGEYSLTLGSDSKDYKVWISELNGTDITTDKRITEQPLIGSLFKSQNASEWVPSPFEDLKMKLYRAVFYTNVTSTVNLIPTSLGGGDQLDSDPLEVFPNSTILKVYHFNHALVENSYVALRNVANANVAGNVGTLFGLNGNLIQDVYFQVANVELNSYTVTLSSAVSGVTEPTRFGGSGVYATSKNIGYSSMTPLIATYKPANTNIVHKVITTTPATGSTYTIDTNYSTINNSVDNKFDTSRVVAGLSNKLYKTANAESLRYRVELSTNNNKVSPVLDGKQLGIVLKRNLVNNPSYSATVKTHEIVTVANTAAVITKLSNTISLIGLRNGNDKNNAKAIVNGTILTLAANVSTTNDGQYRVIDVIDSGANIKVAKLANIAFQDTNGSNANIYLITNAPSYITEEAATGGSAYSKYITRQVDLVNASTSIKFLLDVAKPSDANVEFYYKTKLAGDSTNFADIEFTKVSNVTISTSLSGEFYEFTKQVDDIPAFNSIIFKIVLLSDNEAQVPKIKNFRLIALE